MQPGVVGLIVLPATIAVGCCATCCLTNGATSCISIGTFGTVAVSSEWRKLAVVWRHSVLLIVVSAVFWVWAAYKLLVHGDYDFGTVSFLISGCTACRTAGLCAAQNSPAARLRRVTGSCDTFANVWLLPAACMAVATNYAVVLIALSLPYAFQLYLVCGAIFWSAAALRSYSLLVDLPWQR